MSLPIRSAGASTVILAVLMGAAPACAAGAPDADTSRAVTTSPAPDGAPINRTASPGTEEVATRAWRLFLDAWDTGNWQPFVDMTTDDFEFAFPFGPHAGRHLGEKGKAALRAWIASNRGIRIRGTAVRVTIAGDTAVFESIGESVPAGGYHNTEAIIFQVKGEKVSSMREYWGLADPFPRPASESGTAPSS